MMTFVSFERYKADMKHGDWANISRRGITLALFGHDKAIFPKRRRITPPGKGGLYADKIFGGGVHNIGVNNVLIVYINVINI
jgi:hypothetical protein